MFQIKVTVENFIRLLTGRLPPGTPRSKQLLTDDGSNIFIYMTGKYPQKKEAICFCWVTWFWICFEFRNSLILISGHGGDGFLKFQDNEEISDIELADAFQQMWEKKRYNQILFMIDTCQAASMYKKHYSPNIVSIASSQVGQDSFSVRTSEHFSRNCRYRNPKKHFLFFQHHHDTAIGVYVIDRYTYYALEFLERITQTSKKTLKDLVSFLLRWICSSCLLFLSIFSSKSALRKLVYRRPVTDMTYWSEGRKIFW